MAAPLAVRDLPTLAAALEALRTFNPEPGEWQGWDRIAREGAEAARRGDLKRAKSACTRCHTEYRREYRERYATRKLP
jgi:hypothetical protein